MTRFFAVFLICLLLLPGAARAAENQLPENLQHIWAIPDCGAPTLVAAYSGPFVLQAGINGNKISRLEDVRAVGDYFEITGVDDPYYIKATNDGILMERLIRYGVPGEGEDPFANEKDYRLIRYTRCEKLFSADPAFNNEGLGGFTALAEIAKICGATPLGKNPACRAALFAAVDEDKNKALDYRELALAYRKVVFLAASNNCPFSAYFPGQTSRDGPLFAAALIDRADTDRSRALSLSEIGEGLPVLLNLKETSQFTVYARSLGTLLPFIGTAARLPGCSNL